MEPPAFQIPSLSFSWNSEKSLFYISQLKRPSQGLLMKEQVSTPREPKVPAPERQKIIYGLWITPPRLPHSFSLNYPQGFKTFRVQSRQRHALHPTPSAPAPTAWGETEPRPMTQSYEEHLVRVFGGIEQDKETPLWSIQTAHCVMLRTSSDCGKAGSILLQLADHDRVSSDVYSWSKLPHGSESSPNSAALLTQVSVVLGMTWLVRMCLAITYKGQQLAVLRMRKIWVLSFKFTLVKRWLTQFFPNIFICILDFEGNILNMCEPLHSVFLALPPTETTAVTVINDLLIVQTQWSTSNLTSKKYMIQPLITPLSPSTAI